MSSFRLEAKIIKRSQGRSAIAAAAYRAGQEIHDDRTGELHDYSRKRGVIHSEILIPTDAPRWATERQTLWNAVEAAEKRSDAQVAREVIISLPHELSAENRTMLVREFVQKNFVDHGMVADISIHEPSKHGDQRNHHAHIMLATRRIDANGFAAKDRNWNHKDTLKTWREDWAKTQNRHLEQALGKAAPQVTHKSYLEQGIERIPGVHLGPAATALERRRVVSERGNLNREAGQDQSRLKAARAKQDTLNAQIGPKISKSSVTVEAEIAAISSELLKNKDALSVELKETLRERGLKTNVTVGKIEAGALAPFEKEERDALRQLNQARETNGIQASPKEIMSWLRNPAGKLWQTAKKSMDVDAAARKLERVQAGRLKAKEWLSSPEGVKYVTDKYRELNPELSGLRTKERKLRRNIASLDRDISAASKLGKTVNGLRSAGLADQIKVPERSLDRQRYLKTVNQEVGSMLKRLKPEQAQTLQRALTKVLGIGR